MGRMTYAVKDWCRLLTLAWPELPSHTRQVIARDLAEELKRDDDAREEGREYKPLGMDCDRAAWDEVWKVIHNAEAQRQP